jgi:hypothetical protein
MLISVEIIKYHPNAVGVIKIGSELIGEIWVYEKNLKEAVLNHIKIAATPATIGTEASSEEKIPAPEILQKLAQNAGGKIDSVERLPDGSGIALMSMPLPEDHWLTKDQDKSNIPPMPFRMGIMHPCRKGYEEALRAAGRYAVRCATLNGTIDDFDPDALINNLIVGFLGYHSGNGLSSEEMFNPKEEFNSFN